jgi:hypothetical protein
MVHQIGVMEEADGCRLESELLVKYHEYIIEQGRTSRVCGKADSCGRSERKGEEIRTSTRTVAGIERKDARHENV